MNMTVDAFCKEGSDTTINALIDVIKKIVETEAPVSLNTVAARLCSVCGFEKVNTKIMDRIDYMVKRGKFCCLGFDFGEEKRSFIYKDPSDVGAIGESYRVGGDRQIVDIPLEELVACAIHITSVQYGMPEENLAKEVASAFGFKRAAVTSRNYKICAEAVKYALDNKYLVVDGNGRVILVP